MENQDSSKKEISELQSDPILQKSFVNNKIILISIFTVIIITIVFLGVRKQDNSKELHAAIITTIPQVSPQKDKYVTEQTKIASSLKVPPLYSDAQWKKRTVESDCDNAFYIVYKDKNDPYPLPSGNCWSTTLATDSAVIESYYENKLSVEGWNIMDGSIESLKFDRFNLSGVIADGVCGGTRGYMGYKDGMVRIVSIKHMVQPCSPHGEPNVSVTSKHYSTTYTVFISDPIPLEEISAYIKVH